MAINKVIIGKEVKLDLTADTVSEDNLLAGATAHNAAGEPIVGAVVTVPVDSELSEESANAIQNMAVAKAVNVLKSDLDNIYKGYIPAKLTWQLGVFINGGEEASAKIWASSNSISFDKPKILIFGGANLWTRCVEYDENGTFTRNLSADKTTEPSVFITVPNYSYRFSVTDNSTITQDKLKTILSLSPIKVSIKDNIIDDNNVPMNVGKYVNYSTGVVGDASAYSCSDLINVCNYNSITIYNVNNVRIADNRGVAFYDENKNYISGVQYDNKPQYKLTLEKPKNAKYIRITADNNLNNYVYLTGYNIKALNDIVEQVDNTESVINVNTSFAMFEKFAVIGDSYASGQIYNSDNVSLGTICNLSWGQVLARKNGNACINMSSGGLTTRSWLTAEKGLSLLQSSEPQQLYICALGINDRFKLGIEYLGSISDININDSSNNADTFYGNYGKIISAIKTKAPNAKIIMSTCADNTSYFRNFNEAIINIANLFSIPYIVQAEDKFFKSSFYVDNITGGHPIAITYAGMANAIQRMIEECMKTNVDYFKDFVG